MQTIEFVPTSGDVPRLRICKTIQGIDACDDCPKLQEIMPWTETTGKNTAYIAAGAELIGSIGALMPLILANTLAGWEWAVWISPAAVIGLTIIQLLAIGVHVKRNEISALRTNITLITLGIAAAGLIIATS